VLVATVACLAAAALVGCGGQSNPGSGDRHSMPPPAIPAGTRPAARAALKLWASFPATASPRPIVLLGGAMNPPAGGFTSDVAKLAFVQGNFRLSAPLPTAPARSHGYAIVPVGQALKTTAIAGPALVVTRVTLGTASFQTDRGLRELPAWKLYFSGGIGPATLLAVAPGDIFVPPRVLKGPNSLVAGLDSAAASSDGRTITVAFAGGLAGSKPCDVNYSPFLTTSAHAVAISVIPHPVATGPNIACPAIAQERHLTFHPGRPLGGRVLINGANGAVIPVAVGSTRPGTAT